MFISLFTFLRRWIFFWFTRINYVELRNSLFSLRFFLSYVQESNFRLTLKAGTERKLLGVRSSERSRDITETENLWTLHRVVLAGCFWLADLSLSPNCSHLFFFQFPFFFFLFLSLLRHECFLACALIVTAEHCLGLKPELDLKGLASLSPQLPSALSFLQSVV